MLQISACEARSPPLPARKARDIREEDNYKIKFRLEVDFLSSTLPCHLSVVFPTLEMFEAGLVGPVQLQPTSTNWDVV